MRLLIRLETDYYCLNSTVYWRGEFASHIWPAAFFHLAHVTLEISNEETKYKIQNQIMTAFLICTVKLIGK